MHGMKNLKIRPIVSEMKCVDGQAAASLHDNCILNA